MCQQIDTVSKSMTGGILVTAVHAVTAIGLARFDPAMPHANNLKSVLVDAHGGPGA